MSNHIREISYKKYGDVPQSSRKEEQANVKSSTLKEIRKIRAEIN
jgi:hypothetical protein